MWYGGQLARACLLAHLPADLHAVRHALPLLLPSLYPTLPNPPPYLSPTQVVAVGPGREEEGKAVKPKVDVGATVLYSKYSGTEVR